MTSIVFFRLSLGLPMLVPLPFAYIALTTERGALPSALDDVARLFAASLVVGGIPYIAFAVYGFWWLRRRTPTEILRRMKTAPLECCLWLVGGLTLFVAVISVRHDWSTAGAMWVVYTLYPSPFAIVFGYFYVLIVLMLYRLLLRLNVIRDGRVAA